MLLSLLLIIFPSLLQLYFGTLSVMRKTRIPLFIISMGNVLLQVILTVVGIKLVINDMQNQEMHCGTPSTAIFLLGLLSGCFLLFVIFIQSIIVLLKRFWQKRATAS